MRRTVSYRKYRATSVIVEAHVSKGTWQLLKLGCKDPSSAREWSSFFVLAEVVLKDLDKWRTTLFPNLWISRKTCPRDKQKGKHFFQRHVHLSLIYLNISVSKFWTQPLLKPPSLPVTAGWNKGARLTTLPGPGRLGHPGQTLAALQPPHPSPRQRSPRGARAPMYNIGVLDRKSPGTDRKLLWQ